MATKMVSTQVSEPRYHLQCAHCKGCIKDRSQLEPKKYGLSQCGIQYSFLGLQPLVSTVLPFVLSRNHWTKAVYIVESVFTRQLTPTRSVISGLWNSLESNNSGSSDYILCSSDAFCLDSTTPRSYSLNMIDKDNSQRDSEKRG